MDDDYDDSISPRAAVAIGAVSLGIGVALGLFLNKKGRVVNFKFRPSGWWMFLAPAIEFSCNDTPKTE